MKRFGKPLMLLQTLAMLMMLPPQPVSIFGNTAWIIQNWARALRLKANSQSASLASSTVPA